MDDLEHFLADLYNKKTKAGDSLQDFLKAEERFTKGQELIRQYLNKGKVQSVCPGDVLKAVQDYNDGLNL